MGGQLSYSQYHSELMLGMAVTNAFKHTDSMANGDSETLPFGRGVIRVPNTKDQVRLTRANYATLTLDADLIAANSTIITVNTVATTATVYATSHAATMAAIVAKVAALTSVANAWLDSTNNRIIHIVSVAETNTSTGATTLGSSQPTWTAAISGIHASKFFGVVMASQFLEGTAAPNSDNEGAYPLKGMVNVWRRGRPAVYFETAFDPDVDTLYVRHTIDTDKYIGNFLNNSDSGRATSLASLPIRVISHLTAAGLGEIELNLP